MVDRAINVSKVGDIDNPSASAIRIVHISDTHLLHDSFYQESKIPDGDVLVHSGDFSFFRFKRHLNGEQDYQEQIHQMNQFFSGLTHKYKIFICGNHETNFPHHSVAEIQKDLPGIIYLQDASVEIEGLTFYGTPWCGRRWFSFARSYVIPYADLYTRWQCIPDNVDVLITHNPPYGVLDRAVVTPWQNLWQPYANCDVCGEKHEGFKHFGCKDLLARCMDIRPKVHLFGHVHECNNTVYKHGVLFSNAAMKLCDSAHVIDYYRQLPEPTQRSVDPNNEHDQEQDNLPIVQYYKQPDNEKSIFSSCNIL